MQSSSSRADACRRRKYNTVENKRASSSSVSAGHDGGMDGARHCRRLPPELGWLDKRRVAAGHVDTCVGRACRELR